MIAHGWRALLLLILLGLAPGGLAATLGNAWAAHEQAGVALMLLGLALMLAEALLPSFGVAGLAGIVAFSAGAMTLMNTDPSGLGAALALLIALGLAALLLGMARKARRRAQVAGDAALLGSLARVTEVQADNPYQGSVQAQGEEWQAQCTTPLQAGQHVRVTARHGLVLEVSASAPTPPGE